MRFVCIGYGCNFTDTNTMHYPDTNLIYKVLSLSREYTALQAQYKIKKNTLKFS